jgi:hypothetical protein
MMETRRPTTGEVKSFVFDLEKERDLLTGSISPLNVNTYIPSLAVHIIPGESLSDDEIPPDGFSLSSL